MKKVGILGGMGPQATVLLMQKIIDAIDAIDDNEHIPLIVHQNTQVPSRIKAIVNGTGVHPANALKNMAVDLEKMGCELLAMPCNTAHSYYSEISSTVSVPLLNMIDLSLVALTEKKYKKIGILASPAVKKVGLFNPYLDRYGLEGVFSENTNLMLGIITEIKKGKLDSDLIKAFISQVSEMVKKGCDGLLIACTELSLLSNHIRVIDFIDTIDCLTQEIVQLATKEKENEAR